MFHLKNYITTFWHRLFTTKQPNQKTSSESGCGTGNCCGTSQQTLSVKDNHHGHSHGEGSTTAIPWLRLGVAGAFAILAEALHWLSAPEWMSAITALIAIICCGVETYKNGWMAIVNRKLNINALMSVAVTGAFLIGKWPEAAMVMVLFTIAELLEELSLERARNAIKGLLDLSPKNSEVLQTDGRWELKNIEEIAVGARIRIKPGESVPLDGVVVSGNSTINQSSITGESMPVEKNISDTILAGTINQNGSLEYQTTTTYQNTTLAKMIHLVEEAQSNRAPTQKFIDKFSSYYTPAVFVLAILIAILPPLLFGASWGEWIYKGLVMLVISCPCALVISTPVTIVSALASSAKKGVLIKGGTYLELGRKLKWLALDKTGTLTQGTPVQSDVVIFDTNQEELMLKMAVSLAIRSDHPASLAIAKASSILVENLFEIEQFEAIPGKGTQGLLQGKHHFLGNPLFIEAQHPLSSEQKQHVLKLEEQGKTVILFATSESVLALFAISDSVRKESRDFIEQLNRMQVEPMMLTGDNPAAANEIAKQVGIKTVFSSLLPAEKLAIIKEKSDAGIVIGMIGDGINDAPALTQADIGFAMGKVGGDIAIESADVILMDDNLNKVPYFIQLSQKTYIVLWQNILLALGVKVLFLILTLLGITNMWMAVFADVGTTLIVIMNGLRLLYHKG